MPLDPRPRFSVAHYITEPTIYRRWFFPELDNALGPLWPLILIMAVSAAVYIVWRSNNKILRVIAAAALATAVVYLFTPLTAAGQEGSPTGFFTNTRYLIPGLVLAMVLLPVARPLRAPGWARLEDALIPHRDLRDHGADHAALGARLHPRHGLPHPGAGLGAGGAGDGALAAARSAASWSPARRSPCCFFAVVLGRAQQVQYAEHHYTKTTLFLGEGGPQKAYAFAQRKKDTKIGIIGSSEIIFGQYGFYGNDASNDVEYIGVRGAARLQSLARRLQHLPPPDQRRRLRIPDHQRSHPGLAGAEYWYPIYRWIKDDPALELVIAEPTIVPQPDYVFKVNGELDPAGCTALPRAPAEPRPPQAAERVLADQLGGALGLLPPEHVADVLEDLEPGAGDERGDQAAVDDREYTVDAAVDDQRRHRQRRQALVGVVAEDRLQLQLDDLAGDGRARGHRGERRRSGPRRRGSRGRG